MVTFFLFHKKQILNLFIYKNWTKISSKQNYTCFAYKAPESKLFSFKIDYSNKIEDKMKSNYLQPDINNLEFIIDICRPKTSGRPNIEVVKA